MQQGSCTSSAASTSARSAQAARPSTEFVREPRLSSRESLEAASSCSALLQQVGRHARSSTRSTTPLLRSLQAGRLQPRRGRPLRPGQRALLPLHLADSPLSRSDDPPPARPLCTGKKPHDDFDELVVLGDHCSERERRAEAAERELIKVKLLIYMATQHRRGDGRRHHRRRGLRPLRPGTRSRPKGWCTSRRCTDDYYRYDEASHTLRAPRPATSSAWATSCA